MGHVRFGAAAAGRSFPAALRRFPPWTIFTIVSLSTGAALLVHVLLGVSFLAGVLGAVIAIGFVGLAVALRLPSAVRAEFLRQVGIGAAAGAIATVAYDVTRYAIVVVTQPHVFPFEAVRVFGRLLAGPAADPTVSDLVGIAYHFTNGTLFGVAFVLLVRRPTIVKGLLWAAGLEVLMVAIYPGWLDIRAVDEFVALSATGHAAYGLVLALLSRRWIGHADAPPSSAPLGATS